MTAAAGPAGEEGGGSGLKGPRPALGRAPAPKRAVGGVPDCSAHPAALFTAPAQPELSGGFGRAAPFRRPPFQAVDERAAAPGSSRAGVRLVRGEAEAPRQAEAAAAPSPLCCRPLPGERPPWGAPWCCRGFGTAVRCGVTLKSPPAP